MRFRPFLWLTIVSLPALLVLVGLGSWQLQRLQWKNELIASFESRASGVPIAVPIANAGLDDVEFRRLALVGTFQHDKEVFLTGRTYEGNAGFHGFHVLVGTLFLAVCWFRGRAGHFTADQHFGFEAAAWYWHFVDVVWLFLFAAVYWWGG